MSLMNEQAVSICIPTYNGEKYLRQALESAVKQTYRDIEILVVDDGSTDNTLNIANEFAAQHSHIRVIKNTSPAGMVGNWMKCIEEACYPWIKYLFQDDLLQPDCVEKMMDLCQETNSIISFCRRDFILESNAPSEYVEFTKVTNKAEKIFTKGLIDKQTLAAAIVKYHTENIIGEPTCLLFHKKLLEQIGPFSNRFYQSVDFEFALRAALVAGIAFTPEPLVFFRVHGGSQTSANTSTKRNPDSQKRIVRSMLGDDILLFHAYWADERFQAVQSLWPKEELVNYIRYMYLRACRKYGNTFMRGALQDVLPQVPEIKDLRYNYVRYKLEKWKYKAFKKRHAK